MSPSAVSPGKIRVHKIKKVTRSGVCLGWVFVKLTGTEMNLLQHGGQGKTGDEEQISLPVVWSETGDK